MIANPSAGCRHRLRLNKIKDALGMRRCKMTLLQTSAPGDAERMAAEADPWQFDVVAAAGGDGTINEVVNGLGDKSLPLAIAPLGTANVLATEINLPSSVSAIADTIAYGRPRLISLGEANGRRFTMMASVGLDADVVASINLEMKRYIGKYSYIIEILRKIIDYKPKSYQLDLDGVVHDTSGVIIANGGHYGGRFVIAPEADLTRPSLEVCHYTRSGRIAMLRYALSLARNRLASRPDYEMVSATRGEISGPCGAPVQADGDVVTTLPVTIRVLPGALNLIYPRDRQR